MKQCKRLLAMLSSLVLTVSLFALPYGSVAAEDTTPTSEFGQVVGVIQQDAVKTTCNGGDFLGRTFTPSSAISLTKASGNYAIVMEINIHQDYGFTDAAWMQKSLGDGGTDIFSSDNGKFSPGHLITTWLPQNGRANDTWMKVAVPLSGYGYTNIQKVQLNIYNHPERYDTSMSADDRKYGASISYRNVYVVDMSRNADGSMRSELATFGSPAADEITHVNADGNHTVTSVPTTKIFYNGITSDIALDKMNLEFDMMYSSDNADFVSSKIVNGNVRLYDPSERNAASSYTSGKLAKSDTWYHISIPLTSFSGMTDATGLTQVYAFNYNDASVNGKQTNPGFTSHVKNIRITHSDMRALQTALEDSKTILYDVDDNATAYEAELDKAKALLANTEATYDDFVKELAALNTAKAALTNLRTVTYDVGHYPDEEKSYTSTGSNSSGTTYFVDWKYTKATLDLSDGKTYDVVEGTDPSVRYTVGANRYLVAKITVSKNDAYTGDLDVSGGLPKLSKLDFRLRGVDGKKTDLDTNTERRTDTYTAVPTAEQVNADGSVTYTIEYLLDESRNIWKGDTYDRRVDWSHVNRIWANYTFDSQIAAKANNSTTSIVMTVEELKFVDKTVEAINNAVTALANDSLPVGKYTAASTEAYRELQSQAKAMMASDEATLQAKNQLLKKAEAAKNDFVAVIPEYIQFGTPESITSFTNTGVEGKHYMNSTINVTKNAITGTESLSTLQLRMEILVTRDDGMTDVTNTLVNGDLTLYSGSTEMKKSFGKGTNSLLGSASAGKWNTVCLNLSDFTNSTAALSAITKVKLFAYNDLRGSTSNPGITVQIRNVAVIDGSNSDLLNRLKAAFDDVTEDGAKEFTPDSLAAYQAVYDEWYTVYENVDLSQAEEAIAAMAAARKTLVCVDPFVMTFNSWNGTYNVTASKEANVYANWKGSDQGTVDLSVRNYDNLRLRFDLTFVATGDTPLPETLTVGSMRLAIRKQEGNPEYSLEFGNAIKTLDPTKANAIDLPFTNLTGSNEDGLVRDILMWMHINELADAADGAYQVVIANARVVDATKENMAAALKTAATMTLDEMGDADGVVYNEASATALKAAQAAALELLNNESITYVQLADAQQAINDAKAQLTLVGHTLMTFSKFANNTKNFMYNNAKGVYMGWTKADQGVVDLSRYTKEQLVLRINFFVGSTDPENYPVPETVTLNNQRLSLASRLNNQEKALTFPATYNGTYDAQNGFIEIPLSKATDSDFAWTAAQDIIWYVQVAEFADDVSTSPNSKNEANNGSGHYYINATGARVVDVTAEENLGTISTVGNGRVDITGGLTYGKDDTLTAATTSSANFVGWKQNNIFTKASEDTTSITLPVTGSQDVAAYFVNSDETAVVYYGKYNRVIDVQVVKAASELSAPSIPTIIGQTTKGWDTEDDALAMAVDSNKGGSIAVNAVYVDDTASTGYTLTLINAQRTNGEDTTGLTFDTRIEAAAVPVEGKVFSHWTLDGMKVSTADTYTFYVSGDNTVEAVYVDSADDVQKPALSADINQQLITADANGTYTISMIAQTYMPEDMTLMEYGLIYAPNEATLNDLASYTAGKDYLKIVATSRVPNRQYKVDLLKVKAGRTRYGMAYITVRTADGTVQTVYSSIVSATTPAA